jgi:hypothetical protein
VAQPAKVKTITAPTEKLMLSFEKSFMENSCLAFRERNHLKSFLLLHFYGFCQEAAPAPAANAPSAETLAAFPQMKRICHLFDLLLAMDLP